MGGVAPQRNQHLGNQHLGNQTPDEQPEQRQPAPASPPRTLKGMFFAMGTLMLVAFGLAGLLGQCSFSPLGPSVDPSAAPVVDLRTELPKAARQADFPVVSPQPPAQWRPNSASTSSVAPNLRSVRVGWLTGSHYVRLSQSPAPEEALVAAETKRPPRAEGSVEAAGRLWDVYLGVRSEKVWVGEHNGIRLLITGNGSDAEFRTLAEAAVAAPTIPAG